MPASPTVRLPGPSGGVHFSVMPSQPSRAVLAAHLPPARPASACRSAFRCRIAALALAVLGVGATAREAHADQVRAVVAAGPALLHLPGDLSDLRPWVPGIALDCYAAVPGSVAKKRAPRRYRNMISNKGEFRVAPLWLSLLPKEIYTGPDDSLSVWGARWEIFGIGSAMNLGGGFSLHAGIDAPAVSVLHFEGPAIEDQAMTWNIGLDGAAGLTWRPAAWIELEAGWTHQLGLATARVSPKSGERTLPWQFGVARFLVHGKFPIRV